MSGMRLPKLTHLQFLVLGIIRREQRSGKHIRNALRDLGIRKSGPSFYQSMARLEDVGYVRGWYEQEVIDSQIIRERFYEITALGNRTWLASREFYLTTIERFGNDPVPA